MDGNWRSGERSSVDGMDINRTCIGVGATGKPPQPRSSEMPMPVSNDSSRKAEDFTISITGTGYDIWLTDCGIISFLIESSLEFESRGTTNCTMKVPPPRSRPTNEQKSLGDGPFLGSYSNFCERQIQNLRQRPRSVQLIHDQHRVLLVKTP